MAVNTTATDTAIDPRGVDMTPESGAAAEMMINRQAQEVQAAIVIAKRFPRDQVTAYNRVIEACKRRTLAENAMYEYPRGKEKVSGASIRLAEAIAQNWGNIDFGITVLEQKKNESQVMAYAWDLETNTRQTRIFTVKHWRDTKAGGYPITDQRDIYELVANNGARRLRACILGVIPGDVVDAAMDQCTKTMEANNGGAPIIDTVRSMAEHFQNEFGITLAQLEKYIGWKAESFSMQDIIRLKRVYTSLKDGMAKKEDIFDMRAADDGEPVDALAEPAPEKETKKKSGGRKKAQKEAEPEKEEAEQEDEAQAEYEAYERAMADAEAAEAEQEELPFK